MPNSIKQINFNKSFDKDINKYPLNLEKLIFENDSKFRGRIKNLPKSIKYIELPRGYMKKIYIDDINRH